MVKERLYEVAKGDDVLMEVANELYAFLDGKMYRRVLTEEEIIEKAYKGEIENAKKEGISKGTLTKAIETATIMIKDGLEVETISRYTGLDKKQIESIMI